MAAAEPTLEPEMAAKKTQAIITLMASPPWTARTMLPIRSIMRPAMLPRIMRLPARMNIGTAMSG